MRDRVRIIQILFGIWATILVARLGYWQIIKAQDLSALAEYQQTNRLALPAARGLILARDGFPLVDNKESYLVYINPQLAKSELGKLTDFFTNQPSSPSALPALALAKDTDLHWLILAKNVSQDVKNRLTDLKIPGLGFESFPTRSYPEGTPSAYLSGFVGKNENDEPQGYFGLEGFYDRYLRGAPGKLVEEKDGRGAPIVIGGQLRIPAQPGTNLVTSIDRVVQHIVFTKLSEGLAKYQALSGTATIVESATGRVLAMVSLPGYDPSKYSEFSSSSYKNPIVSSGFEPGSTFKTVVMAAGLDSGAINKNSLCSACSGPQSISGQLVRNYDNQYYANNSLEGIILHSDNVGMVYVAKQMGRDKLLSYLRKFGFGKPTGIDVQDEESPELRPDSEWYEIDWATAAFGQGIAVTPIQMVSAVNAIAQSGKYLPPRLVTEFKEGTISKSPVIPEPSQIISPASAELVTQLMVNGVTNGQVKWYKPKGYTIAGKTGTAQVPIEGHYDKDKTIASFIGFAPVPNPKFTMLVTVREPNTSPWGSTTAAPIWFSISEELFRYFGIPPSI